MKTRSSKTVSEAKSYFASVEAERFDADKNEAVHSLSWNYNGSRLGSASGDSSIRIWWPDNYTKNLELKGLDSIVFQFAWHPKHTDNLASVQNEKQVMLWDTRSGKCSSTIKTPEANINLGWSPDAKYIAVGDKSDNVHIIDVAAQKILQSRTFQYQVNEMAWNHNSTMLHLTSSSGTVEVLDHATLKTAFTLYAHTASIYTIKFSPGKEYFACGSDDALVSVWNYNDMVCLHTIDRVETPVRAISFSHNDKFLATAAHDSTIDIAYVPTGELVTTISGEGVINSLAWHPTKPLLAYGGKFRGAGEVSVWGYPRKK